MSLKSPQIDSKWWKSKHEIRVRISLLYLNTPPDWCWIILPHDRKLCTRFLGGNCRPRPKSLIFNNFWLLLPTLLAFWGFVSKVSFLKFSFNCGSFVLLSCKGAELELTIIISLNTSRKNSKWWISKLEIRVVKHLKVGTLNSDITNQWHQQNEFWIVY